MEVRIVKGEYAGMVGEVIVSFPLYGVANIKTELGSEVMLSLYDIVPIKEDSPHILLEEHKKLRQIENEVLHNKIASKGGKQNGSIYG